MSDTMYARRNETYEEACTLDTHACPTCGILYAAPAKFFKKRREDGSGWYCPNGHSVVFRVSDAQKERARAEAAEQRAEQAESTARRQRLRAEASERSARALKGHLTRIKNRIANGVCPVPGCKRTGLVQTMRHIATKHPRWHAEHVHELSA